LALPAAGYQEPLDRLVRYDAVALFIRRAADVSRDFSVTPDNAPTIAEICARLDGLPLAIELAAARVPSLAPRDMLTRLDRRLQLLTRGARDRPERHRTIRAAIAWSHELLEPGERTLFRRLAVFAGGATLESAEGVCVAAPYAEFDLVDDLASLVEKSLVRSNVDADGSSRYRMLETVREFALEELDGSADVDAVRDRHATWFAELAEDASRRARATAGALSFIDRLERECDNLRAAMSWSLSRSGLEETAFALALSFEHLLEPRGYAAEGRVWGRAALAVVDRTGSRSSRAAAVVRQGGGYDRLPEAMERFRVLGDRDEMQGTLNRWGCLALERGDLDRAELCFRQNLDHGREIDPGGVGVCFALGNLAAVAYLKGDFALARQLLRDALDAGREGRWPNVTSELLKDLGCVEAALGDTAAARGLLREALRTVEGFGAPGQLAKCLAVLAGLMALDGDAEMATRLFAATEAALRSLDPEAGPLDQAFDPVANDVCGRGLAALAATIPAEARSRLWEQGAELGLEAATALALSGEGPTGLA
jgi:tetratricopeptide (TPR) repeat protein